jgi:uridine phosphorylase
MYGTDRIDPNFDDENHTVVDDIVALEPDALTMEMETYLLFHLAECSKIPIHATAASIVVANRKSSSVVDEATLLFLEANGGVAALKTLILQAL